MKIDQLHIDGFGIFHDKNVKGFKPGINILYGKNEAGKSTLLDFIRFTLFDYPTYKVDRREPLMGGNHGGTIWMHSDKQEPLSVFRTGDKKNFQLSYHGELSDNEEAYKRLIGNATADLYNNIFAVSIDELSEIGALDESGMKHKIFSMGLGIGDVDLGAFENVLNAHALSLFRPRGSTQKMIELVSDLEEKESKIHKLQSNLTQYNSLTDQAGETEQQLDKLKKERGDVYRQLQKLNNYSKAYEHFVKYKQAELEMVPFQKTEIYPEHYLETYKEITGTKKRIQEAVEKLEHQVTSKQKQYNTIELDAILVNHLDLLDYFKRNIASYEEALTKKDEVQGLLKTNQTQQKNIINQLGNTKSKKALLSITNTHGLIGKADEFQQHIEHLEHTHEQKSQKQTDLKNSIEQLKHKETSLQKEQKEVLGGQDIKDLQDEKNKTEVLLNSVLQGKSPVKQKSNTVKYIAIILSVLLMVSGGVLYSKEEVISAIVFGGVGFVFLIVSMLSKQKPTSFPSGERKEDPLALNKAFNELKNAFDHFQRLRAELETIRVSIEGQEISLLREIEEKEALVKEIEEVNHAWVNLLEAAGLPVDLSPKNIRNYIKDLNTLQDLDSQEARYEREVKRYEKIAQEMVSLYQKCYPEEKSPSIAAINNLITALDENNSRNSTKQDLEKAITTTKDALDSEKKQIKTIEEQEARLYETINVTNASDFYDHFEKQDVKQKLSQEIQQETTVIKTICGLEQFDEALKELEKLTLNELGLRIKEQDELFKQIELDYSEKEKNLARIRTEIKHILAPNEMYALLNEKESLEAQLKDVYKEWLATKVALKVLNETKLAYEKEKQPEVITYSRDYFKSFTNNAYSDVRISLSKQEVGLIDHAGRLKEVSQLSRGTKEQLMLALRLGLITEYEKNAESLPIVFDDIMVNFDKERAANICTILKDFSKERQVIFFTCHEYTTNMLKEVGGHVVEW